MVEQTKQLNRDESGTDQHPEKNPDSGCYKGQDPTTEYLKGYSPDRRAVKNRIPEPDSTNDISAKRWEH